MIEEDILAKIDIAAIVLFIISIISYSIYLLKIRKKNKLESDLIEAMRIISQSMKNSEGLETAITKIARQNNSSVSTMFSEILDDVNSGLSFEQSIDKRSKSSNSKIFDYFSYIVKIGSSTGEDISNMLDALSEKVWSIKHLEIELRTKTTANIIIIQAIAVIIIPILFVFSSGAIGYTVDTASYVFLGTVAFIFSIIPYIIFNDKLTAALQVPLCMSILYLALRFITPVFANFFTF